METIHSAGYHPPRDGYPPVIIDIQLDTKEPDRSKRIPQWTYSVEVKVFDRNWIKGGTLEAVDEHQAELRVQSRAIDLVAEVLAHFVTKDPK